MKETIPGSFEGPNEAKRERGLVVRLHIEIHLIGAARGLHCTVPYNGVGVLIPSCLAAHPTCSVPIKSSGGEEHNPAAEEDAHGEWQRGD
jgi:hypothetical protein